jgi:ribose 5-phosphate isomerase A
MSDELKRAAARAAIAELPDAGVIGLGSGSTIRFFVDEVGALVAAGRKLVGVPTSRATAAQATKLGIPLLSDEGPWTIDVCVDGADEVDPRLQLIKGGGGAHTREKVVAAAAERFVVIASADKVVDRIVAPIPLELLAFGLPATLRRLGSAALRHVPLSPDGGAIADYHGEVPDPASVAARLSATPGVVDHGLFGPELVSDILIARGSEIEHRTVE